MNTLSFDSKRCERIRLQLDSYLSNELLVETATEIVRHLESCEACSRDLESRMRVRDALQRAVAKQPMPDSIRAGVLRKLRESQPRSLLRTTGRRWAVGLAAIAFLLLSLFAGEWFSLHRGEQLIASILKLGVSDHLICAITGHNYPELANSPDQIRKKLGAPYAPLLRIVQERVPGFEVLEGHVCSIPGSDRKYVHFITRGQGTILSVILTERNGASLPKGKFLASAESAGLSIYEDHLSGMEIAGFESAQYFAFVVSDLSQHQVLQVARELAPALNERLCVTGHILTPSANDGVADSMTPRILTELPNAMKRAVVEFKSNDKMVETRFNLIKIQPLLDRLSILGIPSCYVSGSGSEPRNNFVARRSSQSVAQFSTPGRGLDPNFL
jgi:Putative zinc-finger